MRNNASPNPRAGGRKTPPATPLLALLRDLKTAERRTEFALLCGTSVNYLYQLGTCARQSCRVPLARRIVLASEVMGKKYGTETLTLEKISTMCAECGL